MLRRTPLRRSAPLKRGPWAKKPQKPLERRTRLRQANSERRRAARLETHGSEERQAFIREEPCYVCVWIGRKVPGGRDMSEPSHYPSRAAGGKKRDQYPSCHHHHTGAGGLHVLGVETFERRYGLRLQELTALCDRRWRQRAAGERLERLPRRDG